MALSLLNYFMWDIEEARVPFMIADVVVVTALHFIERSVKAERALQEMSAGKKAGIANEQSKQSSRALKKQNVADQKKNMKMQKHHNGSGNNRNPGIIQQPSKGKSN